MGAPVVHFEIISRNGDQLKGFYAELFGWEINSSNPMNYGLVKKEKNGIGGGIGSPGPDGQTQLTFYAAVPDPQATLDKAVGMGATVVTPVTVIPGMVTFALFKDPDGNCIGIIKDEQMSQPSRARKSRKAPKRRTAPRRGKAKKSSRRR